MKKIKYWIIIYTIVFSLMIGLSKIGSDVITVISENTVTTNRRIVVIDPGHGGVDGGATSVNGILESKLNLDISLKLRDMFHLLGIKTVMIRTEDISVYTSGDTIAAKKVSDLKERVRIVNQYDDGLLISIHQNYFTDSRYFGPQVFYGPRGEGDKIAFCLQKELTESLNPGSSRQAKSAQGIYLMQQVNCSSLLIECGFLSNPDECMKLQDKMYQLKLCSVIASVTSSYLNT